jgi:hypothetical protein
LSCSAIVAVKVPMSVETSVAIINPFYNARQQLILISLSLSLSRCCVRTFNFFSSIILA